MGSLLVLGSFLSWVLPTFGPGYLAAFFLLVVLGLAARTLVGCRRYDEKN